MDRDLQKAISKGAKLKKTVTNDRSGPTLDAGKPSGPSGGGGAGAGAGMGGPLFANKGMPQLRPTGPRSDIRPTASVPVKSSAALPSANSGFGPKISVPPSRPQNTFGNGPIPPPPPRENPGARPATRPAFGAPRAPAPVPALSNTRPPPPPNRAVANPSKPAPPSGFKANSVATTNDAATTRVSPFARPGAPAPPPNFRGGGPRAPPPEQKNSPPISSFSRPPSFSSGAANRAYSTGGSAGKIPTPPPNIPYTPDGSQATQNAVPPPPSRVTPQMKSAPPPKAFVPAPAPPRTPPVATQSTPVSRANLPSLPGRAPPPTKQDSVTRFPEQPPPPARSNPPPPPSNPVKQWGKNSMSEESSPMHSVSSGVGRPRNAAPPPPPPGTGRGLYKSHSPPPALPSARAAPPLPPARSTTPPLNNPPPLPDRDRGGPPPPNPNRAFSPNGTSRPAPAPPGPATMPGAQELERKYNFPRDLPQPIAFKSAPKTYPSHDQEHATRNRPPARGPAPVVTDPTKRPPPPPPPV